MDWGWKRSFKLDREAKMIIGLDIGLSSVKMVRLCKDGDGYAVTACGMAEIPMNADQAQSERRKLSVTRAVRECLEFSGVNAKWAVCGVSGPEVAVRDFEFPAIPLEEVEGAVRLEASQVCPFNTNDSSVDYQLMPNGQEKMRGILVAATNSVIGSKVDLAKDASLDCIMVDVDGLALLNCFTELEQTQAGQTVAILNVGGSYTTVAIMGADGWPFIRDMIHVGDDIVKQVAADKNMPLQEVRRILAGGSEDGQSELRESLEAASRKLVTDVTETLRYYNTQNKAAPLEKIFMCGGFALAEGFVEFLNSQLPVETVLWDPFAKMQCETGRSHKGILQRNIFQKNGPAMAVAAGLGMRSI